MQDLTTRRWDRTKWTTVFSSHSPTIRDITECLGLGLSPSASTTKRGIPKFESADHKQLSAEVTRLSKLLPQERDELLGVASDPNALEPALNELMENLGPKIWGRDADRSNLLTPDPESKKYVQDLFYEEPEHRDILRTYIERWIIIKACYSIRNRKLKKPSLDGNDSLADAEAASPSMRPSLVVKLPIPSQLLASLSAKQSPVATPTSGHLSVHVDADTPPAEGGAQQPHVIKKRSSSAFLGMSDQEDGNDSVSGARKRSHVSATLPIQRKSHMLSFEILHSAENGLSRQRSQSPTSHLLHARTNGSARTTPTPDSGRSMTSPPPSRPINLPSFAAVNAPLSRPVEPAPSTAASSATASPNTFAAVNSESTPKPVASNDPVSQPPPRIVTTQAPHTGFAAVNAPSGFTAVNASNAPPAGPAPAQNGYASPYTAEEQARRVAEEQARRVSEEQARRVSEGHAHVVHRHAPAPPAAPREPSPQKQPTVQSQHRSESPYHHNSFASIAPNPPQQPQQAFHNHHVPSSHAAVVLQPKPHPSPRAVPVPNGAAAAHPHHIVPSSTPSRPLNNVHMKAEHAPPPQPQPPAQASAPTDTTLSQFELLTYLLQFFFPRQGHQLVDETYLLRSLEHIWQMNAPAFRTAIGPLYDLQTHVLFSWIQERFAIIRLKYLMDTQPGVPPTEAVDRLLAMNDLRIMRLKWKALRHQDGNVTLSAEDLLCRCFAMMTTTDGTETTFKNGLERLNETLFGFLKSEDMKIIMGTQQPQR